MDGDIPLAELQLCWELDGDPKGRPPVRAMQLGDKDDPDYFSSWGACNMDFNEADDCGRVLMLFVQIHQMTLIDGVDPDAIHQALLPVPEYRAQLPHDYLPPEYRRD